MKRRPMWHDLVERPPVRAVGRVRMPLPPVSDPWAPHPLDPPWVSRRPR